MNILTISGCICKEIEAKEIKGDHQLKMFCLANSIGYGDKKEDIFWNVLLWNNRHDKILSWLKKGRLVTVVGTLHSKPSFYQKDGEIRANNLQITAEMIHLLPERKPEEPKQSNEPCPF